MWLSGGALVQPGETDPGFFAHMEQAKATNLGALDTSSPARCSPSLFDLWYPVSVQFRDLFSFLWQTACCLCLCACIFKSSKILASGHSQWGLPCSQ